MERTGIQVENEKSRPILTAKNICVLVYVLTPNNETGGSGEEPPVSSILESNSAKLRAKNSVLQSKMNNLCQISRQIFRRSFSRNSARYKTFMFLCQVPRLCQIDRLPCPKRFLSLATLADKSRRSTAGSNGVAMMSSAGCLLAQSEISTGGSISSRNTSILHSLKPMTPRNGACGPLECGPG
nr:MAG TPA: hypothetical protein [Caudoviricetes sp.]